MQRSVVRSQESTVYSQGLPSININPKLFYFAFGLENPLTFSRFIDEGIYYPKVYFIRQKKEKGMLITKEKISLDIERCDVGKFGEEYKNQFTEGELNNSYCLTDLNLTLVGGSKYEKSSFIQIKIHSCSNNSKNNNCKPQKIIDSYLTSGYFSITIKDIGLNPLNYSFPIIPIIQNLKTNVDITMCRESLIYLGIAEVQTDLGLFSRNLKKENFLEYRKYSQSFFYINKTEYHNGKEIFSGEIKLEEHIHVQKREYTKMSEVFSITGGYIQLISTIFALIVLLTRNINIEQKVLNNLFNYNIKQRKIILSIQYEKNLNYSATFGSERANYFVPFGSTKNLNPYMFISHQNNQQKNDILTTLNKTNNTLVTFINKYNSGKANNIKSHSKISEIEENHKDMNIFKSNVKSLHLKEQNRSNLLMLYNSEPGNDFPNDKTFGKKLKKVSPNCSNHYSAENKNEKELKTQIKINMFEYFCFCGIKEYRKKIEIFDFGVNFYKSQMSILNIFHIIFLAQIMVTNHLYKKKHNISNQIIEIPIKS